MIALGYNGEKVKGKARDIEKQKSNMRARDEEKLLSVRFSCFIIIKEKLQMER